MNYNYTDGKKIAKDLGLTWMDSWIENFDQHAYAHGFSQAQVDICIHHHLVQVNHLFSVKTYTLKQRIGLACHFLFGRKK